MYLHTCIHDTHTEIYALIKNIIIPTRRANVERTMLQRSLSIKPEARPTDWKRAVELTILSDRRWKPRWYTCLKSPSLLSGPLTATCAQ